VQAVDNAGNEQATGNNQVEVIFETSAPTVSGFALKGNYTNSLLYFNGIPAEDDQVVKVAGIFNDTGGSPGTLLVQFSDTGVAGSWGVYPGSGITNTIDAGNNWAAGTYKTISASAISQDITNSWRFATPDGLKTLHVRVKDAAGNILGYPGFVPVNLSNSGGGLGNIASLSR